MHIFELASLDETDVYLDKSEFINVMNVLSYKGNLI